MTIQIPIQYDFHHFFPGKQLLWFNSKMVGELVASMKLVPAQVNVVAGGLRAAGAEHMAGAAPTALSAVAYDGTHGGIRALHLHFNNQIYILTDKQWADISQKILTDVKAKLSNVKEISFEEGVILASMFEG